MATGDQQQTVVHSFPPKYGINIKVLLCNRVYICQTGAVVRLLSTVTNWIFWYFDSACSFYTITLIIVPATDGLDRRFSSLTSFLFLADIHRYETTNGYYSVLAYYIAKVLCEYVFTKTIPLIVYSTIVYFMAGRRGGIVCVGSAKRNA